MRNPWTRSLVLFVLFEAFMIFILVKTIMTMRWLMIAIGIFGVVFMGAMVGFAMFGWKNYDEQANKMAAMIALLEAYERGVADGCENREAQR